MFKELFFLKSIMVCSIDLNVPLSSFGNPSPENGEFSHSLSCATTLFDQTNIKEVDFTPRRRFWKRSFLVFDV